MIWQARACAVAYLRQKEASATQVYTHVTSSPVLDLVPTSGTQGKPGQRRPDSERSFDCAFPFFLCVLDHVCDLLHQFANLEYARSGVLLDIYAAVMLLDGKKEHGTCSGRAFTTEFHIWVWCGMGSMMEAQRGVVNFGVLRK